MAMNNCLAEVHPELISEWSEKNLPLTPDDITFGSNKKVWWKGTCGHEWQASVKARTNGEKCPICSGARVIAAGIIYIDVGDISLGKFYQVSINFKAIG